MGVFDTMRSATGKIGAKIGEIYTAVKNDGPAKVGGIYATVKNDGPAKIGEIYKTVKNDGPSKIKEFMPVIADEVLKRVPGGKPLCKIMRKNRSSGTFSGELREIRQRISRLEIENSSLKVRISLCESEISSLREENKEWRQDRNMLMASMLALSTHAETKSWQTLALLLTMSDPLLSSDHAIISVEARPGGCIQT